MEHPRISDIRCASSYKLLAQQDVGGIYLLCKQCRRSHFYSWSELAKLHTHAQEKHTARAQT